MFTSQIRSIVLIVVNMSLLMSALAPWFQSQCEDTISHEHHDRNSHSPSPLGHHHPCPSDQLVISGEHEHCSSLITFCCGFDATSDIAIIRVLHHAPWSLLDHWSLPRTVTPRHETSIKASMIRFTSSPRYSVPHSLHHTHSTLGIFLI